MPVQGEALDIILRLQGVPTYTSGMSTAAGANDEFAASSKRAAGMSNDAAAASERQRGAAALVGKAMKGTGILLAAAAVEGIKMSIKFGAEMERIHTQAGATQAEVESMSTAISNMKGVRQSPIELAQGLYHLESVGLRGKAALDGLRTAAQGAAVGGANLEDVSTALGAAWLVGAKGAGNLRNVMGILNATVGAGNLRMEELVQSLGSGIIPLSKVAHISIQDIGAALATLKDSGYNASSAMAQLGTSLHFLYDPTTKARKALESIGLTSSQVFTEMAGKNGLHGALALLKKHLEGAGGAAEQAEKIGEILPGGRGKVLITLMEELERFETKKKQIIANSGQFSNDVKETMETPAYKIAEAWSQFQKVLLKVGQAMEGPASSAMVGLMGIMSGVLGFIMEITDHGKLLTPIILGLAGAFTLYKTAVILAAIAEWAFNLAMGALVIASLIPEITSLADVWFLLDVAMDANPIGLIALAILALGAGLVMLILHFRAVSSFLRGPWGTALLLGLIMLTPWIGIPLTIAAHWKQLMGVLKGVAGFISSNWGKVANILEWPFKKMWETASWVFKQIKNFIKSIPGTLEGGVSGLLHSLTPHFAEGGVMPYSGFATINERGPGERVYLPGGSTVEPSSANSMLNVRAHTPTPTSVGAPTTLLVEAYLMMPNGAGRSLFKLITKEAAIKSART